MADDVEESEVRAGESQEPQRLFIALVLPEEIVHLLAEFRDCAADSRIWRRLPDTSLHLTLVFLGNRTLAERKSIQNVIETTITSPFDLALGTALLLPPRRPRVLGASILDENTALADFQQRLVDRLVDAELYEREQREFRPHVTVARLRTGQRAPREVEHFPAKRAFIANRVVLYRSLTQQTGSTYEVLAEVKL